MSLILSQFNPSRIGQASLEESTTAGTAFSYSFQQGFDELNPYKFGYKLGEFLALDEPDAETNPMIPVNEANAYAKETSGFDAPIFKHPVTFDEMNVVVRRHKEERDQQLTMAAAMENAGKGRTAGAWVSGMAGSMLNPTNLALMFVPVVGEEQVAARFAAQGKNLQARFARGLITRESLEASGMGLKGYTASVIDGAVGMGIGEVPHTISNLMMHKDYGVKEFGEGVAMGAAGGAVIHTLIMGGRSAFNMIKKSLRPETRESMATGAMQDFVEGKPLDPARFVDVDDNVIHTKTLTDRINQARERDASYHEYFKLAMNDDPAFKPLFHNNALLHQGLPPIVYHGERLPGGDLVYSRDIGGSEFNTLKGSNDAQVQSLIDEVAELHRKVVMEPDNADIQKALDTKTQDLADLKKTHDPFDVGQSVQTSAIKMENPLFVSTAPTSTNGYNKLIESAKAKGHDGIVIKNYSDTSGATEAYIPFKQENVLPAYGFQIEQDPVSKATAEKKGIEAFRDRKEQVKQNQLKELDDQIHEGRIAEDPEAHHHKQEPDDAEFAEIEDQIKFLESTPGVQAKGELVLKSEYIPGKDVTLEAASESLKSRADALKMSNIFATEHTYSAWRSSMRTDNPVVTAEDMLPAINVLQGERVKSVFDELFRADPELKTVKLDFDPMIRAEKGWAGVYYPGKDKVSMSWHFSAKTLFHELVHASSARRLREHVYKSGIEIDGRYSRDYMHALDVLAKRTDDKNMSGIIKSYNKMLDFHEAQVGVAARDFLNMGEKTLFANVPDAHYGMQNLDEFMAEALSNKSFQLFLQKIPSGTKKNFLGSLQQAVKKLVGLSDEKTLLDDVLNDFEGLLGGSKRIEEDGWLTHDIPATVDDLTDSVLQTAGDCLLS